MAHELETLANGHTAFASARLSAWHQLGTITEACMTADEIMTKAWLGGWKVRKIPRRRRRGHRRPDHPHSPAPDQMMTVRTNIVTGNDRIPRHGGGGLRRRAERAMRGNPRPARRRSRCPLRNRRLDARRQKCLRHHETPRHHDHRRRRHLDLYLAATSSHDGTASLRVDATPVRIVCANTQRAAFAHTKGTYVFRHTANITAQINEARQAMGLMWKYLDAFQAAAERMINETLTMNEFDTIVEQLWPLAQDSAERTHANHRQRRSALRYLIRDADTQSNIAGTRWAGYQAITEYIDHIAPAKDDTTRATRVVAGAGAALKTRAFDLLTV